MPRRKKLRKELHVRWNIQVPATLNAKVSNLLFDPLLHKPGYGARHKLIVTLLEEWVRKSEAELLVAAQPKEPTS